MLKTWLKPHATKHTQIYFFTPPSTLYFILKTHLQVIDFLSLGNSMSAQVLFFYKDFNSKSISFLQRKNSLLSKAFNMDWGSSMCVYATKALGCVFCLKGLLTFLPFIVSISIVGACIFLCDLTCVISLKESSCVGLFIITSLMWLSLQMVEVGSKINEGELEVCAPLCCFIAWISFDSSIQ